MKALRDLRRSRGFSQQQIAGRLGISRQTYSNYELGKREAPYQTLLRLAEIFGVSVDFLLGGAAVGRLEQRQQMPSNCMPVEEIPRIPVYGSIAAGQPILAQENIIGYEPAEGIKNPEEYFYLSVRGDSMIGAGIPDGSLVLIHKQDCTESGQIVACLVNGDSATLKRYKRVGDTVLLMPENSKYEPILVKCSDFDNGYAKILGVAVEVISRRKLN
ncbi:MAG: S24 family peptidase [Firmicutes bacterium]|nr:S24 family peptidase [Bacillota bacterium]